MGYDYRLEELSSIFAEHAKIADKARKEQIEQYMENYPGSPLPEHFLEDFNIAKALAVIAAELTWLKKYQKIIEKRSGM